MCEANCEMGWGQDLAAAPVATVDAADIWDLL